MNTKYELQDVTPPLQPDSATKIDKQPNPTASRFQIIDHLRYFMALQTLTDLKLRNYFVRSKRGLERISSRAYTPL